MPQIKWRQQDIDLLRKEIRNFNRKVDRLMKSGSPEVKAALPPKLSMKTAKQSISSRSDFNKQIKSIKRFTERGSEQLMKTKGGVVAPKFEVKELEARVRSINAQRRQALKELGPIEEANKPLMGRVERAQLRPKKAPGKISPEGWQAYKESVMKQSDPNYIKTKNQRYIENYLKGAADIFGPEKAQQLRDKIDLMDPHKFVQASLLEERLSIGFLYDPLKLKDKFNEIDDYLDEAISETI